MDIETMKVTPGSCWVLSAFAILITVVLTGSRGGFESMVRPPAINDDGYRPDLDPGIGKTVMLPAVDLVGRPIGVQSGNILLIAPGTCTSCALRALDPRRIDLTPFTQLVLLYGEGKQDILPEMLNFDAKLRVVADPYGSYLGPLNAAFYPRYYLLDSKGTLLRLSRKGENPPSFVHLRSRS